MRQILLVEDEFIIAKDIQILLAKNGTNHIHYARNYQEALTIFKNEHIDAIICDINLNDTKDGIEVVTILQEIKPVPVVYLTAYYSEDIMSRVKVTMPFAYLLKPFNETQLLVTIDLAFLNFKKQQDCVEQNERFSLKIEELTNREKEILVTLASGKTSKEIGDYLNISFHTVEKHKKNIKTKLELNTIGELVHFALSSNLYEVS